jgi:flagellar assembly protein FliH
MTVLDAENAANAVRWELPRLGGPAPSGGKGGPATARELDDVERSAHAEGMERGRKEGYVQGRAEALSHINQLRAMLGRFARPMAELEGEVEQILVHLSTAVCAALWRGLAGPRPEMIQELVREAIATLPAAAREVEVQLHPDDLAALLKLIGDASVGGRLTPNPVLNRGDLRVHTDLVRLDATLASRLANATEALLDKGA